MNQEEHGFVYIWFDRKYLRYYIGSHLGDENDGYVCSSKWMKKEFRERPHDFKRRIIKRVDTTRQDLYLEERRWLSFIPNHELGDRYYNLHKSAGNWPCNVKHSIYTRKKISNSLMGHVGTPHSIETRAKISKAKMGKKLSEEHRKKISNSLMGHVSKPHSIETRAKISNSKRGRKLSEEHRMKISLSGTGRKHSEETREKIRKSNIGQKRSDSMRLHMSIIAKKSFENGRIAWNKGMRNQ